MTVHQALPAEVSGHRFDGERRWEADLSLGFARRQGATRLARVEHRGPLRVQRPFYPEGRAGCCHAYLLHPPGGLVSGDALRIEAYAAPGAHALLTTPAAAKLYRADSCGVAWSQDTCLRISDDATLEYLPQETIAFDGSRGRQTTRVMVDGGGRSLGWEVLVLGRRAGDQPFARGLLEQRFEVRRDGVPLWLERQIIDPGHPRFGGYWGQGGATVQATLWAVGLVEEDAAVAALRDALPASREWAVTRRRGVLLLRYLGGDRNRAWAICQCAWEVLRPRLAGCPASVPRIWLT